jgi:hypothetical protein
VRTAFLSAAQHRPDPGDELARIERLGKIIVGAYFKADNPVNVFSTRRKQ